MPIPSRGSSAAAAVAGRGQAMSAKNEDLVYGDHVSPRVDVGLVEIQMVAPAKQEPAEDTSDRGAAPRRSRQGADARRDSGPTADIVPSEVPHSHAADTPAQHPSTRRDGSSAVGGGAGAPDSGAAIGGSKNHNGRQPNQDAVTSQSSLSSKAEEAQGHKRGSFKQDKSVGKQDKSVGKLDRSWGGAQKRQSDGVLGSNLDSSSRSGKGDKVCA